MQHMRAAGSVATKIVFLSGFKIILLMKYNAEENKYGNFDEFQHCSSICLAILSFAAPGT